jgi:hypothetical protein
MGRVNAIGGEHGLKDAERLAGVANQQVEILGRNALTGELGEHCVDSGHPLPAQRISTSPAPNAVTMRV